MSMSIDRVAVEPRWKSYLPALAFLAPALAVWMFAVRYLYPKVQVVWRDGGAVGSDVQWIMDAVGLLVNHGGLALAVVAVALGLLELRPRLWRGHRRFGVGSVVLLLNVAILLGLATLCLLTLYAAPGLRHA